MSLYPDESLAPSTWADGFGVWHACIPASGNRSRDAHLARHLIKSQLNARDALGAAPLIVRRDHETNYGTVVYCEAT